ncbi:MAG: DUF1553 domain-containing protein [Phycisphaeraceae bacterium]
MRARPAYFAAMMMCLWSQGAAAEENAAAALAILENHCIRCHHEESRKGKLSLATRADLLKGGRNGAAITVGNPDASRLIKLVTPEEAGVPPDMPEEGQPLTAAQRQTLRQWIKEGATWPEGLVLKEKPKADHTWWSLQPVKAVDPPTPAGLPPKWEKNPIDRFVFARLTERSLLPSPEADRRTLVRRLYFDLLGLPPTPKEVDAFVNDDAPDAYEKLVDQLLASPHLGERWARHWLDIAHYADTHGFERDMRRDHAWRYRDYVIESFNSDKPYDRFLQEQIAGDVIDPTNPDAIIATGFLAAGPFDFVGQVETQSGALRAQARADDLDDMVTTVISAAMGLTVNCARCHDHKIDPIPQKDYYALWAVFSGVKRGDRKVPAAGDGIAKEIAETKKQQAQVLAELGTLEGKGLDLADIIGGGNGSGTGVKTQGIDPRTGKPTRGLVGYLDGVKVNAFVPSAVEFVDGIVIPGPKAVVPISSTGLTLEDLPATGGKTWDYVQLGPVHSQRSTELSGINYNSDGHSLLGLHANKIITFDLDAIRAKHPEYRRRATFRAVAGYGGREASAHALCGVYLDGKPQLKLTRVDQDTPGIPIDIDLDPKARFLTLVALDGGNDISHDQVFFGDPRLVPDAPDAQTPEQLARIKSLREEQDRLQKRLVELGPMPAEGQVYAVVSGRPEPVHVLQRGDPALPLDAVAPAALSCIQTLDTSLAKLEDPEGKRRLALAKWITDPANPLTSRVIVNRLWYYHFGQGIVSTPSDFGFAGGRPSHPELLDWLAGELGRRKGSLKAMHRLIVTSQTYRQSSMSNSAAASVDADNRLLWRMNPHRLEVEAVRDAVLTVSGSLNTKMGGPGYEDFKYRQEYAPVYTFFAPDRPELWRRTIYRFVVRTTPNTFLTALDCPDPSVLTPTRNRTTTALQSLALLNNRFMMDQARLFAQRLEREAKGDERIDMAFRLAFSRGPTEVEKKLALELVQEQSLFQFCRMLLNANEFVYVD